MSASATAPAVAPFSGVTLWTASTRSPLRGTVIHPELSALSADPVRFLLHLQVQQGCFLSMLLGRSMRNLSAATTIPMKATSQSA